MLHPDGAFVHQIIILMSLPKDVGKIAYLFFEAELITAGFGSFGYSS